MLASSLAGPATADVFVRDDIITKPTFRQFSVCFGHGCERLVTQSLTQAEWQTITRPLRQDLSDASDERIAIAETIGELENIIGLRTGTDQDKGGNLAGFWQTGQMDCIDESTNTTTYLRMLAEQELLQHHTIEDRATRFGFFVGAPHTTAVIRESVSGSLYAVDSWFFDNGMPPVILDIQRWDAGWVPLDNVHE